MGTTPFILSEISNNDHLLMSTGSSSWPNYQGDPQNTGQVEHMSGSIGLVEEDWEFRAFDEIRTTPVIGDGQAFIGSWDGFLYAIDTETGELNWEFETENEIRGPASVSNGSVYVIGGRRLYSIDIDTGNEEWNKEATNSFARGGVTAHEGVLYVPDRGRLIALDESDGSEEWIGETEGMVSASPAIKNNKTIVGDRDGYITAFDKDTGAKQWEYDTRSGVQGAPTIYNGRVIVGNSGGAVVSLDIDQGDEEWTFGPTGDRFQNSAATNGDRIFIGSVDSSFFALRFEDGEEIWQKDIHTIVSPLTTNDHVITTEGSNLLVLNSADGEIEQEFDTNESFMHTPAVSENKVFFGGNNNNFNAIILSDVDPEPEPEPTPESVEELPGFGIGTAVAGLGSAGYLLKRRLAENESNSD